MIRPSSPYRPNPESFLERLFSCTCCKKKPVGIPVRILTVADMPQDPAETKDPDEKLSTIAEARFSPAPDSDETPTVAPLFALSDKKTTSKW